MSFLYAFSYIKENIWKYLLSLLSLTLGVAILLTVLAINETIINSYKSDTDFLFSENQITVRSSSGGPVENSLYARIKKQFPATLVTPVSTQIIYTDNRESATLVGTDLFFLNIKNWQIDGSNKELPILYSKIDLKKNKTININGKNITAKVLPLEVNSSFLKSFKDNHYLTDIATFQELTRNFNNVDYLIIKNGNESTLANFLGNKYSLKNNRALKMAATDITKALRANLNFMAAIAISLSVLIIYNIFSYLINIRGSDFGTLRALGASAKQIKRVIYIESFILTTISLVVGILLGIFLANFSQIYFQKSLQTLYKFQSESWLLPSWEVLIITTISTFVVGVIASYLPSKEAFNLAIRHSLSKQAGENKYLVNKRKYLWVGPLLILISPLPVILGLKDLGLFIPPTLVIIGIILVLPNIINLLPKKAWNLTSAYVFDHLSNSLKRLSATIAAICISVAMVIGIGTMIYSFRLTVKSWINQVINADIYLTMSRDFMTQDQSFFPSNFLNEMENDQDIKKIDYAYFLDLEFNAQSFTLIATPFKNLSEKYLFKEPLPQNLNHQGTYVSESFLKKHQLKKGDSLVITIGDKQISFPILGSYIDYKSEFGTVTIDFENYHNGIQKIEPNVVSLFLKDPSIIPNKINKLNNHKLKFLINNNHEIKQQILEVFDSTFSLTYNILFISLIVSILNLITNLKLMLLDQARNFAALRATGANQKQISKIVSLEAILIIGLSSILGIILGLLLAYYLVYIVNPNYFGWAIKFQTSYLLITAVLILPLLFAYALRFFNYKINYQFLKID